MRHFSRDLELNRRARGAHRMYALLLSALLLAPGSGLAMQVGKLYPVDESARDHSFAVFRRRLLAALKRRDRKHLMSVVHPEVKNGFGDDDGAAKFAAQWQVERPDSQVWQVLSNAFALGGTFEHTSGEKMFCAPYVSTRFPDALDAFTHQVVVAKKVNVRSRPSAMAPVTGVLSYDIVKIAKAEEGKDGRGGWVKVVLKDGERYIPKSLIRSPLDHRVCFTRVGGKWLLTSLVAGD